MRNNKNLEDEEIQVEPFIPPNWYSERGALKKLAILKNKGLPSFYNWRFLTLTIDPLKFKDNQSAYLYVKKRFRYFIRNLKVYLKTPDLRYCWKLEFQENGNPHWHVLIDYRKSIDIPALKTLWSYGNLNLKRCRDRQLPYAFKYLCKEANGLPKWFLQLSRPRVFQSSGMFVSKDGKSEKCDRDDYSDLPSDTNRKIENLGDRLKRYSNSIIISKITSKSVIFIAAR